MYNIEDLNLRLLSELREIAKTLKAKNYDKLSKQELIYKILDQQAITPETGATPEKETLQNMGLQKNTPSPTRTIPRVKKETTMQIKEGTEMVNTTKPETTNNNKNKEQKQEGDKKKKEIGNSNSLANIIDSE